ncbi:MAG: hypothetical protein NVSMB9_22140 [Isosphaeraceae bacterium]
MSREKCISPKAWFLPAVFVLGSVTPGCGSGSSGDKAEPINPEMEKQVMETISKGYMQDYKAKNPSKSKKK